MSETRKQKVSIIGSGPAGLTAAMYTARAQLEPIVFTGPNPGGQLMQTTLVENYPGFIEGIQGPELMQNMMKQAENLGATFEYKTIDKVDFSNGEYTISAADNVYQSDSVIIATGAVPRRLGLQSETKFWGRGVSSCATCDGAFYKDKIVAVVGGGSVAFEDINFLTRFVKKAYLVHRRDEFRAEKVLVERAEKDEKIEFILDSEVKEILGDEKVSGVEILNKKTNATTKLDLDGVFIAIGYIPKTEIFEGQVDMDQSGYIKHDSNMMTDKNGIFVAGDVSDFKYRQAVTSAAEGCKSAMNLEQWMNANSK